MFFIAKSPSTKPSGRHVARRDGVAPGARGREGALQPSGRTDRGAAEQTTPSSKASSTVGIACRGAMPGAERLPRPSRRFGMDATGRHLHLPVARVGSAELHRRDVVDRVVTDDTRDGPGVSRSHSSSAATSVSVRSTFALPDVGTRSCGSACLRTSDIVGPRTATTEADTPRSARRARAFRLRPRRSPVAYEPVRGRARVSTNVIRAPTSSPQRALRPSRSASSCDRAGGTESRRRRRRGARDAPDAELEVDDRIGVLPIRHVPTGW